MNEFLSLIKFNRWCNYQKCNRKQKAAKGRKRFGNSFSMSLKVHLLVVILMQRFAHICTLYKVKKPENQ
ncbi:MAG: hypothetical protein JWP88_769 [Flaviaesturariibacter sp.]|nr:hypothetical protein [Flaviaesturariibacter sp.]